MQIIEDHDAAEMLFFRKKLQTEAFLKKKKVIPQWSNQLLLNLLQKQTEVPVCARRWLCCGRFRGLTTCSHSQRIVCYQRHKDCITVTFYSFQKKVQ